MRITIEIKVQTLISIAEIIFALVTCASDWIFYHKISIIEEGLVYGPLPKEYTWCFLFVSIIGTLNALTKITYSVVRIIARNWSCTDTRNDDVKSKILRILKFLIDNVFHADYSVGTTAKNRNRTDTTNDDVENKNMSISKSLMDNVFDVVYKLSKVIIKFLIVRCREEGLNVLLCVTSAIDLLSCVRPVFHSGWQISKLRTKCCCWSWNGNKDADIIATILARFIVGVLNAVITIEVIYLSLHYRSPDGAILSRRRFNLYSKTYDMDRYFKDVGVYVAHPKLDDDWNYNFKDVDWIKLYPFYDDIFDRNIGLSSPDCFPSKSLTHKIHFSDVAGTPITYFKITHLGTDKMELYKVNKGAEQIEEVSEISEVKVYHSYTIIIKSEYISPDQSRSRVFGRIRFNWRTLWPSGSCTKPNITIRDDDYKTKEANPTAIIQYFRQNKGISSESHFLLKRQNETRFYNPTTDLEDIKNVWKSGSSKCSSTGDLAPVFDEELDMDCS